MNEQHLQFLASPEWAAMLTRELLPWVESVGDLGDDVLEVGPGPGLTTDLLRTRVPRLTAVEVDPDSAGRLRERLAGTNVEVLCADAGTAGLDAARYSAATCFSVLHHIPTRAEQDRLFAELYRVLQPGGMFVGTDSRDLDGIRTAHEGDTFNPVDPATFPDRLAAAGFAGPSVELDEYSFRFVARKPEPV